MMDQERILTIDTTSPMGSLCLLEGQSLLLEKKWDTDDTHTQLLLPQIKEALDNVGLTLSDFHHFGVIKGPGSFTGIRIGMGCMLGLVETIAKPLYGISALEAYAFGCHPSREPIQIVMNAYRNQVFLQTFLRHPTGIETLIEPSCQDVSEWLEHLLPTTTIFAGDGAEKYRSQVTSKLAGATFVPVQGNLASKAAKLLQQLLAQSAVKPISVPEAFYIRPPDVFRTAAVLLSTVKAL